MPDLFSADGGAVGGQVRAREVRKGEYASEMAIADAAVGGGTWFDTDNALLMSQKTSILRVDTNQSTIDSNVLSTTVVGGGSSVAQTGGSLVLTTDTGASSTTSAITVAALPQMPGTTQLTEKVVFLGDTGQTNNVRRWGAYNANDGFFFELNGTTFNVVSRKGGVDTRVPFSSWNGVVSDGFWDPTKLTTLTQYNVMYGTLSCRWLINGRIAHTIGASSISSPLTNTVNLFSMTENTNSGVTAATSVMSVRSISASRMGPNAISPVYVNITTATTTLIKRGPGTLRSIIVNTPTGGGTVTVYDNIAASGTKIATLTLTGSQPQVLPYGLTFVNGLTVVTSATNDLTVTYD